MPQLADNARDIQEEVKYLLSSITTDYKKEDSLARYESFTMRTVIMALKVIYMNYLSGYLVDNPHCRSYKPFKEEKLPSNSNLLLLNFHDKINAVIDCYSLPGKIIWKQIGKEDEILTLTRLLYRVSKLSIGEVSKNLINCTIIGIKIFSQIEKELRDYYSVEELDTSGISVISVPITLDCEGCKEIKYNINIQYEKISIWNKVTDKCIFKTENPNNVVEYLLIEALYNMGASK